MFLHNTDYTIQTLTTFLHSTTFTLFTHCLQIFCPSKVSPKDQFMRFQTNQLLWMQFYISWFAQLLFSVMKGYMYRLIPGENQHKMIRFCKTKPNPISWKYFPEATIIYSLHLLPTVHLGEVTVFSLWIV